MPIYVVGLKDGYRGDVLEDQLTQQGLTFRRHVAFDARHLGDAELNELADQTAAGVLRHRPLTSGEIGCALSHRAVHEIISRDDSEWALVLEDDARLVNKSLGALLVSLADTLKAQQPCVVSLFADVDYLVADGSSTESLPEFPQHVLLRAFFAPTYTSAYVINRAAAQLSSAQSGKIDFVADWPPSWACRTNFRAVFPWVVSVPDDTNSTLSTERSVVNAFETGRNRMLRYVATVSLVRYMRYRKIYRTFSSYFRYEIARPFRLRQAHLSGYRLAGDGPRIVGLAKVALPEH